VAGLPFGRGGTAISLASEALFLLKAEKHKPFKPAEQDRILDMD
jgi:hypothetical protein